MGGAITSEQAKSVADRLELGLDCGICIACLSFVSLALDDGDPEELERDVHRMTGDLWDDGLARPALEAAERAVAAGVADAPAALADLQAGGGGSVTARAIVLRLAEELAEEARARAAARE